jgi:hypothetical protein
VSERRPRIEEVDLKKLYRVEVCNPIKEKINEIEVCQPNLEVVPCNPVDRIKCLPDLSCLPIIGPCIPDLICYPDIHCIPSNWCQPLFGPCQPVVGGTCSPSVVQPGPRIEELTRHIDRLTKEIEEIKRRIG